MPMDREAREGREQLSGTEPSPSDCRDENRGRLHFHPQKHAFTRSSLTFRGRSEWASSSVAAATTRNTANTAKSLAQGTNSDNTS